MWSKIIFYLAWILFSAEISSAFFTKPHVVATNQASKPGGATTTVASRESTVQTHPQNIQIPAVAGQHLPNYFQDHQITNDRYHAVPSSHIPVAADQHFENQFPNHQITNEQHHSVPFSQIPSAADQKLEKHFPNHQITNEQHHTVPSSQIPSTADQHLPIDFPNHQITNEHHTVSTSQIPVAVVQNLPNHFPNHHITNDPHPTFQSSSLFHPVQPSHNVLLQSRVADHPQLFHPAALHPQHFNPLPNVFDHHLHPEVAHSYYHPLNFDHRPFNPHDAFIDSHTGHPHISNFIPEHGPFSHLNHLEHIANHLH